MPVLGARQPAVPRTPSSEFLAACVGIDVPSLMSVLDEHMSALRAVYPAEYQAVMSRIRLLHDAHQTQD